MEIDVETTLRDTRNRLQELGEAVENLVTSYPDVFDDPEIASRLEGFRQARQDAANRLDAPSLRIATIGTTSSGKSTIVNALIGRKVAPIEAGEMNGGVLTLQHSDERKLVVEATEEAAWETGEWSGLSDEELYNRIRDGVMRPYHDIRRKQKDCIAPQVIALGPLLPVCERNLLGLPPGVGVEFIDLPGLKSVQDRANLAVIQERVHKAFSLVALDYMQVDDEHRKRLLEELKRVVQYLQGRTDSMIFILNRVDQRGADDIPISERINKLQAEIQEVLSLKEPPEIIPFNARLLYYAQCAWGTDPLSEASPINQPDFSGEVLNHINNINRHLQKLKIDSSRTKISGLFSEMSNALPNQILNYANLIKTNTDKIRFWDESLKRDITNQNDAVKTQVDPPTRLKLLNAMFQDCAGAIRQHIGDDRNLRRWFHGVEEQVADGKTISDETMQQILHYAREWSGGNTLWSRLRIRVQESFPELVILPALVEVFDNYDAFAKGIDTLAEIRKIERREEVKAELEGINASCQSLHEEVEKTRRNFCSEIEETIDALKMNKAEFDSRVTQKYNKRQGFEILVEAITNIKKDLNLKLIEPVQIALKNQGEVYDLEDELKKIVIPILANDIARAYDKVRGKLDSFTQDSGYLVRQVREDDKKAVREIENAERAVRRLYQAMRDALSYRAEFTLQGQATLLQKALQRLAEEAAQELYERVREELPSLKLDEAVITDFKKKAFQKLPDLPEQFFELPDNLKQDTTKQKEVIDKKEVKKTYTEGSCFGKEQKTKTEYENVYGDVKYRKLSLPNVDTMADQWLLGIKKKEEDLWNILRHWMTNYLTWVMSEFNTSIDSVTDLAERSLQEQLKIIEQDFEVEMKRWSEIVVHQASVAIVRQQLENESRTQYYSL